MVLLATVVLGAVVVAVSGWLVTIVSGFVILVSVIFTGHLFPSYAILFLEAFCFYVALLTTKEACNGMIFPSGQWLSSCLIVSYLTIYRRSYRI